MLLYILRVDYVTHDQTSTELNSCSASMTQLQVPQALPAVKLNVLPFGKAWKGENQFSTEPTTGICRSSPCKAQPNTGEKSPPGDELPQGTTGLVFVASPLPAVVLHLLSEAEAVLPVSLF